jgi:mannose-6-phosphate isomerase-like protein (cupin superfamily)
MLKVVKFKTKTEETLMERIEINALPAAPNVCNQELWEIAQTDIFSAAFVRMEKGATSLFHKHAVMEEIYIITRGTGLLRVGGSVFEVKPGNAVMIPANTPHKLVNGDESELEHLVLALPPFNPEDVELLNDDCREMETNAVSLPLPRFAEAIDGARVIDYDFGKVSVAFGHVLKEEAKKKGWHYHKRTTEWALIIDGNGWVETGGNHNPPVFPGHWLRFDPYDPHAFRNRHEKEMSVVCICSPAFDMEDVFFE